MVLSTLDGYIGAPKQRILMLKTATRTTVATIPFTVFDLAGQPGAGTLAGSNTANGVVPTDAVAGYPVIGALTNKAWLTRVAYGSTVPGWITIYERLFLAGAYAFNANTTLASQPSYAARVTFSNPAGADYKGLQIWCEAVTAFTGTPSFQVNYLDEGGAAGDTGVVSAGAALTLGRMFRMPLAAGDNGVQQITQVRGTVASVGTFNVMVLRELWCGRVRTANDGEVHDLLRTGAPELFTDSALMLAIEADSTSSGLPDVTLEIADA